MGWVAAFAKRRGRSARGYKKLLQEASRGMSRIESQDRLLRLVVHFITLRMGVRNAAVLSRQEHSNAFRLCHQRGYGKNFFELRLESSSPLLDFLATEKEACDAARIAVAARSGAPSGGKGGGGRQPKAYDYEAILQTMENLEAACCIPSFLGPDLRNVLVLGKKKSGELYTGDDLHVLLALAQESAGAVENARLYDEAVARSRELERINQQLEYSKGLLMKALKETEVANKALQDTQAQLIHEQKMATLGRLAASVGHEVNNPLTILSMNVSRAILKYRKNPEAKLTEALDLFDKMEQNIGRIKAVVNTLTGLLKRSEKGKFEPLSLKLILEETLPLVQFQTYLDNLTGTEVEFDMPANLPLVRGDLERLQEVFLNLFINAYHAMEGRRDRRIRVRAEIPPGHPHQIAVNFTDNGCGMTADIIKKIFTYGFTTKPPGRGSGMGLYMCKYIIELHGGEMRVASKPDEGTTFTLTLPVCTDGGVPVGRNEHSEAVL
ncbi:MAG: ATP-binding protein [Candidatus Omnitrophota bacterium]|jgi:signal transduction histidine kinase